MIKPSNVHIRLVATVLSRCCCVIYCCAGSALRLVERETNYQFHHATTTRELVTWQETELEFEFNCILNKIIV